MIDQDALSMELGPRGMLDLGRLTLTPAELSRLNALLNKSARRSSVASPPATPQASRSMTEV